MRRAVVLVLVATACGGNPAPATDVEAAGAFGVGTSRFELTDASRSRTLVAQAWFPAVDVAEDTDISELEDAPIDDQYAQLLAAAPAGCPSQRVPATRDAAIADGTFPLVMISHCHACTRLSNATTAARLASHGFVAVTVEHAGDTLWEHLEGSDAPIDETELAVRTLDVSFVLDAVEAGTTPLGDHADLAHVGVLGHSMGAVTAGNVAMTDGRISAAAALCAPMENPLVPGVTVANLDVPLMFVVAKEDNSITELGNMFIRQNFDGAVTPVTKIEVPDAGHWSVSDLDGLVDIFAPGCGSGVRQTDGESTFDYLDPDTGRNIAASYSTAFFRATLKGDAAAQAYLEQASTSFGIELDVQSK